MIIQGSNEPIVLTFPSDMSGVQGFSATLINKSTGNELKHWKRADAGIDEKTVTLNLKESETIDFPPCVSVLKVKWVSNNYVQFAEEVEIPVKKWEDKTRMIDE